MLWILLRILCRQCQKSRRRRRRAVDEDAEARVTHTAAVTFIEQYS